MPMIHQPILPENPRLHQPQQFPFRSLCNPAQLLRWLLFSCKPCRVSAAEHSDPFTKQWLVAYCHHSGFRIFPRRPRVLLLTTFTKLRHFPGQARLCIRSLAASCRGFSTRATTMSAVCRARVNGLVRTCVTVSFPMSFAKPRAAARILRIPSGCQGSWPRRLWMCFFPQSRAGINRAAFRFSLICLGVILIYGFQFWLFIARRHGIKPAACPGVGTARFGVPSSRPRRHGPPFLYWPQFHRYYTSVGSGTVRQAPSRTSRGTRKSSPAALPEMFVVTCQQYSPVVSPPPWLPRFAWWRRGSNFGNRTFRHHIDRRSSALPRPAQGSAPGGLPLPRALPLRRARHDVLSTIYRTPATTAPSQTHRPPPPVPADSYPLPKSIRAVPGYARERVQKFDSSCSISLHKTPTAIVR